MVREIQGPNNQPPKPTGQVGQGGVRSGYDPKQQGGGQGGKKPAQPEPEPPPEEEEEEGFLDADSFARKRPESNVKNFLVDERMPWEVAAEERRKRLEASRQRGSGPLSQARAQAAQGKTPKGLPARAPLSQPPAAKPPTQKLTPPTAGRRVEAGWDADAAANSTLNAYQQLRDRQADREKERDRSATDEAEAETPGPLSRGQVLNRDAIANARKGESGGAESEPAAGPSWLVEPTYAPEPTAPKPPVRPQPGATGPLQPRQPAEPPRPAARKLQTGSLGGPLPDKPAEGSRPTPREPLTTKDAPRREPLVRGPLMPAEPAAVERVVEQAVVASEPVAPEPEMVEEALEEPVLEELLAEEPMLQEIIAQVPTAKLSNRVVCLYQILDGATKKPLANARLEFEPVQDELLPVINGQADFEGVYKGEGIPAGFYQVTVRSPGYIPQMQTHYIKAGEVDEGVFLLKKP